MSALDNLRRIAAGRARYGDHEPHPLTQADARWLLEHIESMERALSHSVPLPVLKSGPRLAPVAVELSRPDGAA